MVMDLENQDMPK